MARSNGHYHKFLQIQRVISMRTTVDDIHHGHWQKVRVQTAKIAPQRYFNESAAARATAIETPKIAFAPSRDLFEYHPAQLGLDQPRLIKASAPFTASKFKTTASMAFKTPFPP